jgi:hypothetical protein
VGPVDLADGLESPPCAFLSALAGRRDGRRPLLTGWSLANPARGARWAIRCATMYDDDVEGEDDDDEHGEPAVIRDRRDAPVVHQPWLLGKDSVGSLR